MRGEDIARRRVLPPRDHHGQVFLCRRDEPGVLRIDLVVLLEHAGADQFEEVFVGEVARALSGGVLPQLHDRALDAADRFFFRDAGVGHPIEMPIEQVLLRLITEIAVVRHAFVVVVGDEVVEVFLEIRAGAGNRMDLALADHLRQRQAELATAHGAREAHQHGLARLHVLDVGLCRIHQGGGIEVAVIVRDEP